MMQSEKQTAANTIRVMLVDDDERIQDTLRSSMAKHPAFELVGQAYSLADAYRVLQRVNPQVVLVDLGLPDGSGLELIGHIQKNLPNCESMVLTVLEDDYNVMRSIEAGATGYLTKDTHAHDILERVRQVNEGGSPISPMIARRLLNRLRGIKKSPRNPSPSGDSGEFTPLSEREKQVLEMVAKGFMQAEIAEIMGVTVNTVSTYVKRIYKKLAVNSRTSAVHKANTLGLINLKDC